MPKLGKLWDKFFWFDQIRKTFGALINFITTYFIINAIYQTGRETQKAKHGQGVQLQKTNLHTISNNTQQTNSKQTIKSGSYLIYNYFTHK